MAFNPSKMELIAGGGAGPCLWSYETGDTFKVLTANGYFQAEKLGFGAGDWLLVSAADKTALLAFKVTDGKAVTVSLASVAP